MLIKDDISLPEDFKFDMFISSGQRYDSDNLHIHDCLEINYVIDGEGVNIIGDKEYEMNKEDIYVINNQEYHYAFSNPNLKLLVIVFDQFFFETYDYEYLKAFYKNNIMFSNLIKKDDRYHSELKELFLQMFDEWNKKNEYYRLFIKADLFKIMAILNRYYKDNKSSDVYENVKSSSSLVNKAAQYIKFNFKDKITLDDLAKVANLNKTYLSTLFKKTMKISISDYIMETRLSYARYYVLNTSLTISEIAVDSGFKNLSHFIKRYKERYKKTPLKERKEKNSEK